MLTINTNLSSLIAQSSMKQSTSKLNQAIERMTTGYKINHAKDNAAMGLDMTTAISENLDLINQHASRIRDLCEQASNGTYGEESLKAIQAEIESRMTEIERIKANAEFNGIKLFDVQETEISKFLKPVTKLTEDEAITQGYTVVKTADDLQNIEDNPNGKYILMNNINLNGYNWSSISTFRGELNGNGYEIQNLWINSYGDDIGLFTNFEEGVIKNLGITNAEISGNNSVGLLAGKSNGANAVTISNIYIEGTVSGNCFVGGLFGEYSHGAEGVIEDAVINISVSGNSSTGPLYGFVENSPDVINCYTADDIANGVILPFPATPANKTNDVTLQVGINSNQNSQITMQLIALETLISIDASSSATARNSLNILDDFIANISKSQTEIGAVQNRLESVLEEITIQRDNLISSRSTIRDADIADVSSHYIQQQILQQASATLLATANQSPSIALQLI